MATKATKENDVLTVKDLAKEYNVAPGEVNRVLRELEIEPENGEIRAEDDLLELAREELESMRGQKAVQLPPNPTPRDIAAALGIPDKQVQKTLIQKMKIMATLTKSLEKEVAENLVSEFGFEANFETPKPKKAKPEPKEEEAKGHSRPPVVTILGHVDHGKTSLLDYIRKTKVVAKEHGGITQHIGAYQAELDSGVITFLDTPGHAAFTAMRARGAQVTDIAILVVAADDGIMPQTKEAISHVKAAEVPMIVAINKIDKAEANPDRILQQLTEHEVIPEEFGGDILSARVSAETGEGIPDLLEKVLLQAEVLELKADPQASFEGIVIESKLEKGRGPVATVLVKTGTLRQGDILVVGNTWGKVKAMTDHLGNRLKEATPAMPVEVLGLNDVPDSGDMVVPADDERSAREIVDERAQQEREKLTSSVRRAQTLRDLKRKLNEGETKDLNLIIKADVHGSVEAVRGLLEKLDNVTDEVDVKIMHTGVGAVTESDVLLASAGGAIIVGFNVKPEGKAKKEAERNKIEIRTYNIIYELVEDIEKALTGMLEPKFEEEYQGTVEIRAKFKLSRGGIVAGSHVTDGKITRNSKVRVRRDDEVVYEGELASLRNVKQDVREMNAGQDCGIKFEGYEDFLEGDVIEAYELVQVG